uniref:Snf2 related CREBBP activator protein n=1 Tax=Podarcis muralis TaxID=64176 RepID=A0A670JF96_PODMU
PSFVSSCSSQTASDRMTGSNPVSPASSGSPASTGSISPPHLTHDSSLDSHPGFDVPKTQNRALEAEIENRIAEMKKEGFWSMKRLSKVPEPVRPKVHWDYLCEEMQWLSADFAQERRWKRGVARKVVRMVIRHHEEQKQKEERAKREEQAKLRRIASSIAKEVKQFWSNVEKVVQFKQQSRLEEKRKKALDLQLDFIVGQTEKYSDLLTQSLNETFPVPSKTGGSHAGSTASSPPHPNGDFQPHDESDDEETIEVEEQQEGNDEETQQREIELLKQESEPVILDEEETIDAEEKLEGDVDHSQELDELAKEGELPMDELLQKYAGAYTSDFEMEDQEEDFGVEYLLKQDEDRGGEGDNDSTPAPGPKKEITDIAAAAESLQPKGYTLDTTQVKTPIPYLLRGTLREYQHIGLDWLVTMYEKKLNGILADEMGLGKTIQTISLLAHLACEKGSWGPHLIIVPTSVILNWEMEIKRWCPSFKILTYYGAQKERKLKRQGWTKPNAFHICITSYKLVLQDHQAFRRKNWKYLILDEAQNIKNFKSQRWQSLLNFNSQRRLLLTGTPLQNSLMELWSLMHFLMPHVFQSHREFKEWFSNPLTGMIEGSQEYNENLVKRLHKVLRPFLLRRVKVDVEKQMPKKYEHVIKCRLSKRQRYLYDDFMAQATTKETLATGHFMSVINILMQLRKVCNHPNLFDPRPIHSPFITEGICFNTASLILHALDNDPFKHADLGIFDLINLEGRVSRYETDTFLPKWKVTRKLIEEIAESPDPPPRPKPVKMKVNRYRMLQPVPKPENRTVVLVNSPRPTTPLQKPIAPVLPETLTPALLPPTNTLGPAATAQQSTSTMGTSAIGGMMKPVNIHSAVPALPGYNFATAGALQQRLLLSPDMQARLPSGEVVSIGQLASLATRPLQSAPGSKPLTFQIQGNKLTLTGTQVRQVTMPQPARQLPRNVVHLVSAGGQHHIISQPAQVALIQAMSQQTGQAPVGVQAVPGHQPPTILPVPATMNSSGVVKIVVRQAPRDGLLTPSPGPQQPSLRPATATTAATLPGLPAALMAQRAPLPMTPVPPVRLPAQPLVPVRAPTPASLQGLVRPMLRMVQAPSPSLEQQLGKHVSQHLALKRSAQGGARDLNAALHHTNAAPAPFRPGPTAKAAAASPTSLTLLSGEFLLEALGSGGDRGAGWPRSCSRRLGEGPWPLFSLTGFTLSGLQESLEEKRKKQKEERLDRLFRLNEQHCNLVPIYGTEVLHFCTLFPPDPHRLKAHWQRADTLAQAILKPQQRIEELTDIIERFIFVMPPVEAPAITMHTSHPPPSLLLQQAVFKETLRQELSPRASGLHRIVCNMRTQFPDLRLIQYDCGKLQTLDVLLRQLKAGAHRVLIFTQMTRMLDVLEQFLNYHGHIYLRLDGSTRVEQRQALMERFNADKRIFCFILSTRSGGVGVNLTGADTVVFYDSDWNPTMDAQAQDRCHRIGQTRDVHIYRLISERTVEENILKKANQKRMLGDMAIEGGNFTTAYFKQQTIRELFDMPLDEPAKKEGEASAVAQEDEEDPMATKQTQILEQALCKAEDPEDIRAATQAKAEQVAELAEFNENIPLDTEDRPSREEEEEMSKAEQEIASLVEQLTPIERYAMNFLEASLEDISREELKQAEVSSLPLTGSTPCIVSCQASTAGGMLWVVGKKLHEEEHQNKEAEIQAPCLPAVSSQASPSDTAVCSGAPSADESLSLIKTPRRRTSADVQIRQSCQDQDGPAAKVLRKLPGRLVTVVEEKELIRRRRNRVRKLDTANSTVVSPSNSSAQSMSEPEPSSPSGKELPLLRDLPARRRIELESRAAAKERDGGLRGEAHTSPSAEPMKRKRGRPPKNKSSEQQSPGLLQPLPEPVQETTPQSQTAEKKVPETQPQSKTSEKKVPETQPQSKTSEKKVPETQPQSKTSEKKVPETQPQSKTSEKKVPKTQLKSKTLNKKVPQTTSPKSKSPKGKTESSENNSPVEKRRRGRPPKIREALVVSPKPSHSEVLPASSTNPLVTELLPNVQEQRDKSPRPTPVAEAIPKIHESLDLHPNPNTTSISKVSPKARNRMPVHPKPTSISKPAPKARELLAAPPKPVSKFSAGACEPLPTPPRAVSAAEASPEIQALPSLPRPPCPSPQAALSSTTSESPPKRKRGRPPKNPPSPRVEAAPPPTSPSDHEISTEKKETPAPPVRKRRRRRRKDELGPSLPGVGQSSSEGEDSRPLTRLALLKREEKPESCGEGLAQPSPKQALPEGASSAESSAWEQPSGDTPARSTRLRPGSLVPPLERETQRRKRRCFLKGSRVSNSRQSPAPQATSEQEGGESESSLRSSSESSSNKCSQQPKRQCYESGGGRGRGRGRGWRTGSPADRILRSAAKPIDGTRPASSPIPTRKTGPASVPTSAGAGSGVLSPSCAPSPAAPVTSSLSNRGRKPKT